MHTRLEICKTFNFRRVLKISVFGTWSITVSNVRDHVIRTVNTRAFVVSAQRTLRATVHLYDHYILLWVILFGAFCKENTTKK